jgi:23S rRNA (uracil1939-C5)-methyltransferase
MKDDVRKGLEIEKLVYRGDGLGHDGGQAVFVPRTAPGDIISWRPLRKKKRYIQGRLVGITTPSSMRRIPTCPLFGRCGGCQWQHLDDGAQLFWKREIVKEILSKSLDIPEEKIKPARASPKPFQYRYRARLIWENNRLGFRQAGSHRLVPITQCPLLVPDLNHLLEITNHMLVKTPSLFGGMGGELTLESGDTGTPRVIFRPRSVFLQHLTQTLKELAGWERLAEQQNFSLWIAMPGRSTPTRITGENSLFLSPLAGTSLRLGVPPGGFYQINLPQNRILSELILHILEKFPPLSRPLRVLDLFCGMGNFSIPLAHAGCQVTGVDNSFHAIETARKNKAENKFKTEFNTDFNAYIPKNYISDELTRLSFYKKLSNTVNDEEIENIKNEMEDRFGRLPKETINFFNLLKIKIRADKYKISKITITKDMIYMVISDSEMLNFSNLIPFLNEYPNVKVGKNNDITIKNGFNNLKEALDYFSKIIKSLMK